MKHLIFTLGLALVLTACPSQNGNPPISSGIWRATLTPDPGQSLPTTADTTNLYELNFGSASLTGWHYACDAGWINCAPKGYGLAVTGALSAGAADFQFTYNSTPSIPPVTVKITGAFTTGGFTGRFQRTAPSLSPVVGSATMVWVSSQR